jgi:BASS family bile acid:Na+ symporter
MLLRGLALLGRHGTSFLAGGLFVGLALPPLAALFRPALSALVFLLTVASFLSIDWPTLGAHARRPGLVTLALAWSLVGVPMITGLACRLMHVPAGLTQGLVLWAAAPPLISVAAIALLLGLDAALALLLMVAGTFVMPFTLPPLVLGLIGLKLSIGVLPLMRNLGLFIGGAVLATAALRRLIGVERLRRHALELSGLNVALLLLFAIGIMDGVQQLLRRDPQQVLLYAATALAASALLQALSFLVFSFLPRIPALTLGLVGGSNNLAVVWANLGPAVTPQLTLFFAAVQLPIYVLPAALKPLYRRLGAGRTNTARRKA